MHVDESGASVIVPYPEKKGFVNLCFVPHKGKVTEKSFDVCGDQHNYQAISFARDDSVLLVATHDGRMIRIIDVHQL